MEFSIRPVREDDARAIVELLNPLIQAGTYTIMDELLSERDQLDFIRGFPGRGVYNVAVDHLNHEVLGIQDVMPTSAHTRALERVGAVSTFVSPACHRKGVGSRLSHATFEQARQQRFLKLRATIRADNPQAIAFYQSQAFEVVGTASASVRGRSIGQVVAQRVLDSTPAAV